MNEKKKGFNLFPEYVWMIFVGMLLAILILTNVLPAKALTEDEEYVIIDDWLNNRLIKVSSDDDGNVFHPGVPTVKAVSEYVNGHWSPLPANNYLPNNFSVNGNLASCILAPPSSWADDDHYRVIQPSLEAIYSIGIPAISVLDDDYYAYFEGGDGLIYAVVSDKPIYLKNKDSRGSFGVYSILPDPDASSTTIYQWTGSWNRFGTSSFSDTSVSDRIAISTLLYGKLYWEDFEYTEFVLGVPVTRNTDNYALYNGILPRLDILSSSFDAPVDIPVDPEPDEEHFILLPCASDAPSYGNYNLMFSFKASGVNSVFTQPMDDTWVSLKSLYPSLGTSLSFNACIKKSGRYTGSWLSGFYGEFMICYVQVSSYSDVKLYSYKGSPVTSYESMISVGTASDASLETNTTYTSSSYFVQTLDDGYCLAFVFRRGENWYMADSVISDIWFQNYSYYSDSHTNESKAFAQNSTPYTQSLILRLDANGNAVPDPNVTPTPEPTATPEPTPSATPIPSPGGTIYVVTPVPPTPPIGFQPYDPGSVEFPALGVQQFENITDQLPDRINNTTAAASLGFLGFLMGFLPAEALWFLWFLLFILVVLAIVRLFIHFTGG